MKSFLIIGNINSIQYNDVFPHIARNEMWIGCSSFNSGMYFHVPDGYEYTGSYGFERNGLMRVSSICWFTNLEHGRKHMKLNLTRKYDDSVYRKYDNYDAIEVPKVSEIPMDYDGVMGVPITYIGKHCPEQFEIIDLLNRYTIMGTGDNEHVRKIHSHMCNIDGRRVYSRILIRRKMN